MRTSFGGGSSLSGAATVLLLRLLSCVGLTDQRHGCHSFYGSPGLAMEPAKDVFAPVNASFVVECRSTPSQGITASDLTFTKGLTDSFPSAQIQIVNDHTLRLSTSEEDPAEYNLYCRGPQRNFCLRRVRIGYPPREAGNFRCISLSWKTLECAFDLLKNPAQRKTDDYFLEYSGLGKRVSGYKCNEKGSKTCCVSFDSDECWQWGADPLLFPYYTSERILNFTLWSENAFGKKSYAYIIDHHKIMVPDAAVNYQVHPAGPFQVSLSWDLPPFLQFFPPGIIYRIHLVGPGADVIILGKSQGAKSTSMVIDVPGPGQTYTVSLSLRSGANPWKSGQTEDGLWSLPVHERATTTSLPPLKAPELSQSGFQDWDRGSTKPLRSILIYWKPLPKELEGGPGFHYLVRVFVDGERSRILPERQTNSSALFDSLLSDASYRFEVIPVNQIGEGESSAIEVRRSARIPQRGIHFPVAVFYPDQDLFHLRWFMESYSGENFTIFWCDNLRRDLDQGPFCEGTPSWRHFPLPLKTTEVTIAKQQLGNIDQHGELSFGVSPCGNSTGEIASTGITWASCPTGNYRQNVSNTVSMLKVTDRESSSAVLEWQMDCETWLGVPQEAELRWCPGTHNATGGCQGQDRAVFLTVNFTSVTLADLATDQDYTVWMRPVFNDTKPELNQPVFFKTTKKVLLPKTIVLLTTATLMAVVVVLCTVVYTQKRVSASWKEASQKLNLPEGIHKPKNTHTDKLGQLHSSISSFEDVDKNDQINFVIPPEHAAEDLDGNRTSLRSTPEIFNSPELGTLTYQDNPKKINFYKSNIEILNPENRSRRNKTNEPMNNDAGKLNKISIDSFSISNSGTASQTCKKFVEHKADPNLTSPLISEVANPYSVLLSNTSFQTPDKGYVKAVMVEKDFGNLVSRPCPANSDVESVKQVPPAFVSSESSPVSENGAGYTKLIDLTHFFAPIKTIGHNYLPSEGNVDKESDNRPDVKENIHKHSDLANRVV